MFSPHAVAPPRTHTVGGRYELVRELAAGSVAVIHLARQTSLGRLVALKELLALTAADARRFEREAALAASLVHPSIVGVLDRFTHDGQRFFAMDYAPQGSLRAHAHARTLPQVAGMLESVLAGLEFAAQRGIVHRDLKPENLLVGADGRVRIADFGIARSCAEPGPRLTLAGTTLGTPHYMSPEQALGRDAGPASDLYSLGVIAYELLAGHSPYPVDGPALAMLNRHLTLQPAPLPHMDAALATWVLRMLAKAPEDRPASARAAWDELEPVVARLHGPCWRREAPITGSG